MITYTYMGQEVELLALELDDSHCADPQDFGAGAAIRLPDGSEMTVYCGQLKPDPERVLFGLPQMLTKLCPDCRVYTAFEEGTIGLCQKCGREL